MKKLLLLFIVLLVGCSTTKSNPTLKKSDIPIGYVLNKIDISILKEKVHSIDLLGDEIYYSSNSKENKDVLNFNKINLLSKENRLLKSYSNGVLFDTKIYNQAIYSSYFNKNDLSVTITKNNEIFDQYFVMDMRHTPQLHIYNNELCYLKYNKETAQLKCNELKEEKIAQNNSFPLIEVFSNNDVILFYERALNNGVTSKHLFKYYLNNKFTEISFDATEEIQYDIYGIIGKKILYKVLDKDKKENLYYYDLEKKERISIKIEGMNSFGFMHMTKINDNLYYAHDSSYPSFVKVDKDYNLTIHSIKLPNLGYINNLIDVYEKNKFMVISTQEESIELYKIEIKDQQ